MEIFFSRIRLPSVQGLQKFVVFYSSNVPQQRVCANCKWKFCVHARPFTAKVLGLHCMRVWHHFARYEKKEEKYGIVNFITASRCVVNHDNTRAFVYSQNKTIFVIFRTTADFHVNYTQVYYDVQQCRYVYLIYQRY